MTDTLKQYGITQIGNSSSSATSIAQAGSSGGVIRTIHLANISASSVSVNICVLASGVSAFDSAKALYYGFTIPPASVHVWNGNLVLTASQELRAYASAPSSIVATVSGVDL